LSNLWELPEYPLELEGIIFLKTMLELTNTSADPNAQTNPITSFETSNEQASMTPMVSGSREMYVLDE
jgi:hypothetical protein